MKTFLAVVGALALVAAAITLFSSLGRRPRNLEVTEVPPVESPDFLISVAGAAGVAVHGGGTARLLNNGSEFFPALLEAIRGARHNINFAVYIWEPGQVSDQFFAALIERARAGVQVRLLLDGIGGLRAPSKDLKAPARCGRQGRAVPASALRQAHALPQAQPPAGDRHRRRGRVHRRGGGGRQVAGRRRHRGALA